MIAHPPHPPACHDSKPLVVDLYCGLGGWTAGFLAEGWRSRGYDIEAHEYGEEKYPGEFVQRDILDMHGSEIADADLIVSSSPCTKYSYMAMPWTRARLQAEAIRADVTGKLLGELNALFDAQFRLQREASEAAGRYIPMVVENVKGAQPWVGRAAWNYGSYYLWGDVPALMPSPRSRDGTKAPGLGAGWVHPDDPRHTPGLDFTRLAGAHAEGRKNPGFRFDGAGRSFQTESVARHVDGIKNQHGGSWFKIGSPGQKVTDNNPDGRQWKRDPVASCSSGSSKRKAASAQIAKIPFALSSHIARVYRPATEAAA